MKKILNFRPALFIVIGLIVSLYSARLIATKNYALGILLTASFLFLCIITCIVYGKNGLVKRNFICLSIAFVICLCSSINFLIVVGNYNSATLYNGYYTVEGKVVDVVERSERKEYIIDNVSVKGLYNGSIDYKIKLNVSGYCQADVGDLVSFFGNIIIYFFLLWLMVY